MKSIVSCRNVHNGLDQGQVPRPIVSYCASPIPPVLFPCSVNKPFNVTCKLETNVSRMAFPCSVNKSLDRHTCIHGVFAFTIPVWFLFSIITYHHILAT